VKLHSDTLLCGIEGTRDRFRFDLETFSDLSEKKKVGNQPTFSTKATNCLTLNYDNFVTFFLLKQKPGQSVLTSSS